MSVVTFIPIEFSDAGLLALLGENLTAELGLPVTERPVSLSLDFAYDPVRNQYHSTRIIERVKTIVSALAGKTIIIVDEDLFIPILTFVFGEAQLGGSHAVVSCARLRNEFYGRHPDEELLRERTLKVVVHELGHLYSLRHCPAADCVMFSSHNLEDTDHKSHRFCLGCIDRFFQALGGERLP